MRTSGLARALSSLAAASAALLAAGPSSAAPVMRHQTTDVAVPSETGETFAYGRRKHAVARSHLASAIEPEMTVRLTPELSLFAQGGLRAVRRSGSRAGCSLAGDGPSSNALYGGAGTDRLAGQGGGPVPGIDFGHGFAAGFNGPEAVAPYGFTERLGFEGGISLSTRAAGTHDLTASTVFLDGTMFDGPSGAGESYESGPAFSLSTVALAGASFDGLPGLHYRLAVTRRPGGEDSTDVETGFIAGAGYRLSLWDGLMIVPQTRLAVYDGADAVRDRRRVIQTVAGRLVWNRWNIDVSWTGSGTTEPDGAQNVASQLRVSAGWNGWNMDASWTGSGTTGPDGAQNVARQFRVSSGYRFSSGLAANVVWMADEWNGEATRTLAAQLSYTVTF